MWYCKIGGGVMTTGQRIQQARKKAGLTQKELGEKLGVSVSFIAQYETDKRKPKKETLEKIAGALDVYYLDLYGDEESKEIASYVQAGMKLGINAQIAEMRIDFLKPFIEKGYEFTESEGQAVSLFNQLRGMLQERVISDLARLCLNPKNRKDRKAILNDDKFSVTPLTTLNSTDGSEPAPQPSPDPQEGTDTA